MDYNNIISTLREIARDQLRLKAINDLRSDLYSETSSLKIAEDAKAKSQKAIEICKFLISKIDAKDPCKEDTVKKEEDNIKFHEEDIKTWDEAIAGHKKTIEGINGEIKKVESGETKISKEDLNSVTEKLISALISEKAKKLAV